MGAGRVRVRVRLRLRLRVRLRVRAGLDLGERVELDVHRARVGVERAAREGLAPGEG